MAKLQIPTYVGTIYCWRKKRTSVKSRNQTAVGVPNRYAKGFNQAFAARWRKTSNMVIEPATAALSELTLPNMGSLTR
jgi:hypothetical protein